MSNLPTTKVEQPFFSYIGAKLTEGITYNPSNKSIIWVDIAKGELHRIELPKKAKEDDYKSESVLNTIRNSHEVVKYVEENPEYIPSIGGFALSSDDDVIIVAAKRGIGKIDFRKMLFEYMYLFDFIPQDKIKRFRANDSRISPAGNFWIGVMTDNLKYVSVAPEGYLVKFDVQTKKYHVLLDKQSISNGIVWNKDANKVFHIDSATRIIRVYDYDITNDRMSNGRDFFTTKSVLDDECEPDGMTIDSNDNIYVACWNAGTVLKINPQGEAVHKFTFPAKKVTCPIIGGSNMDELFVSSASLDENDGNADSEDLGGSIFRVKLEGVKGVNKNKWML